MKHLSSKKIAFTAAFAALYYIMSYLPGIPAIGVPGIKIQMEACMASVFGLILGPYLGALAVFLGVFVAWALPPGSASPQSLIFLPSPVINALIVGLLYSGQWKAASTILSALIAAFWFLPPVQPIE
ncbi:MAG: ECF transporter S component, partial [Candidatus Bathyarchaeia archaeon]